jgi:hypothetical protein
MHIFLFSLQKRESDSKNIRVPRHHYALSLPPPRGPDAPNGYYQTSPDDHAKILSSPDPQKPAPILRIRVAY